MRAALGIHTQSPGYEKLSQSSPNARLTGWIAYTFTSSNRHAYGRTYPFDFEQPHALSLVGNLRLSPRFEVSMTGRLASGFPKTPPLGLYVAGVDDGGGAIIPDRDREGRLVYGIDYGSVENLNRDRHPAYARLDTRVTFVPRWGKGRWRLYVDVLNVFNRKNGPTVEELVADPNSDRPKIHSKHEESFPFLPSFGIHVRF